MAASHIEARRLRVEQLLHRGLTVREIIKALSLQRIVNPRSGKPWSLGTIQNDIEVLQERWVEESLELRHKRKARIAAELKELKRKAWAGNDLDLVRKIIQDERAMFGLDDPIELNVTGQNMGQQQLPEEYQAIMELDEGELDMLISNLLTAVETDIVEGSFEQVDKE